MGISPPRLIAENHQFRNLTEVWLEGDHYKWRAMRANGVPERLCSGDAPDYEKFLAFVQTIPYTLRNPLYHWSHLELQRYFNIGLPINEDNAPRIWAQANECLASPEYRVQGLLKSQRVGVVVTTDDPVDPLDHHQRHGSQEPDTCLYPAFRPDAALRIENPVRFNEWCDRLASVCQRPIRDLPDFLEALRLRHDFFHAQGCRLSDHGLESCLAETVDEDTAARIFRQAREGQSVTPLEVRQLGSHLMLFFGKLDAARGWTKQLHLGALRNNNQHLAGRIGADAGADSIGDFPQAGALAWYLNALDREESLPKMILYNLNPADNYLVATMAGNFYGEGLPGKDSVRERLVVFGPDRGDDLADQRPLQHRLAPPIHRHDHRFTKLFIIPPSRVLSSIAL